MPFPSYWVKINLYPFTVYFLSFLREWFRMRDQNDILKNHPLGNTDGRTLRVGHKANRLQVMAQAPHKIQVSPLGWRRLALITRRSLRYVISANRKDENGRIFAIGRTNLIQVFIQDLDKLKGSDLCKGWASYRCLPCNSAIRCLHRHRKSSDRIHNSSIAIDERWHTGSPLPSPELIICISLRAFCSKAAALSSNCFGNEKPTKAIHR